MGEYKQAKLKDSNIAGIGSKRNRNVRKKAARSDRELRGAGEGPGLEIWRVENKRSKNGTPNFGIRRWPFDRFGEFFTGDSYLVLNTFIEPGEKKLQWDVHFWLGKDSSQDEVGVAAYKAVEIDDLLDDGPIQHREVQGHESELFQSYFPHMTYLEGGIESGFRHVEPRKYVSRLFQVRMTKKTVRAKQVKVSAKSLNSGDVFVLDAGTVVYCWMGEFAHPFEKSKGGVIAHNIVDQRLGKARKSDPDDRFWKILKGSKKDVRPPIDGDDSDSEYNLDGNSIDGPEKAKKGKGKNKYDNIKLFQLSDSTGSMKFEQVGEGQRVPRQLLDSDDAFILDDGQQIYIWIGKGASQAEKREGMVYAMKYIQDEKLSKATPVTRIHEGQASVIFDGCFFDAPRFRHRASRPDVRPGGDAKHSSHRRKSEKEPEREDHHQHRRHTHGHHDDDRRHHRRPSTVEKEQERPKHRQERGRPRTRSGYKYDAPEDDMSKRDLRKRTMGAHAGVVSYRKLRKAKASGEYDGMNPNRLEKYLDKEEFRELFGASQKEFDRLPAWKQEGMKKELGLW